jgi:hypothetical protein
MGEREFKQLTKREAEVVISNDLENLSPSQREALLRLTSILERLSKSKSLRLITLGENGLGGICKMAGLIKENEHLIVKKDEVEEYMGEMKDEISGLESEVAAYERFVEKITVTTQYSSGEVNLYEGEELADEITRLLLNTPLAHLNLSQQRDVQMLLKEYSKMGGAELSSFCLAKKVLDKELEKIDGISPSL